MKRIVRTIVEKAIETVDGFLKVYMTMPLSWTIYTPGGYQQSEDKAVDNDGVSFYVKDYTDNRARKLTHLSGTEFLHGYGSYGFITPRPSSPDISHESDTLSLGG